MTSDTFPPPGTGGTGRVAGKLIKLAPVTFVVAGALTGSTAASAPPSLLDWTSSGVYRLEAPGIWAAHDAGVDTRGSATQTVLEAIKRDSGLTWGQVADALGVEARTIHLWRNGGGISAANETRVRELAFLVKTLWLREPSDVRSEFVDAQTGRSLLDRFRAGADAHDLALTAPWRTDAREALDRSVAALRSGEAVDENFAFMLYVDDSAVSAFAANASALLAEPTTSRRTWEAELDARFGEVEQPGAVELAADATPFGDGDVERYGTEPLFGLEDLDITLGVGAIASRPPLNEEG